MAMRLMPKSEINKARAADQKREIDEGLKLAKRVDNLREVVASEEAALESFRRETVLAIHKDIEALTTTRDTLRREVATLQEEQKEARLPLDQEWEKVAQVRNDLHVTSLGLDMKAIELAKHEEDTMELTIQANKALAHAQNLETLARDSFSKASYDQEEARTALAQATTIRENELKNAQIRDVALTHREDAVATRENSATIKETEILARENALADGWRLLRDREALLERTIARTKK